MLLDDEAMLQGLFSFHIDSKLYWNYLQSFVTKEDQNMAQLNLLLEYVAADNGAANLLPKWIENSQDMGQRCVCVCVKLLILDPC